jgi:hypothetical protein|nr:MAG TPA: hypothetical protein [Caudoviricetes sp.]
MKEHIAGEAFTTDEGKTVQCVRSNGLCSGCVFLANIGGEPPSSPDRAYHLFGRFQHNGAVAGIVLFARAPIELHGVQTYGQGKRVL